MRRLSLADPNMVFGDALWLPEPKYPIVQDASRFIRDGQAAVDGVRGTTCIFSPYS